MGPFMVDMDDKGTFGKAAASADWVFNCFLLQLLHSLSPAVHLSGIESFEEKIGSFASAEVDSNPDSWLNAAFKKIGVSVDDVAGKEGNLKGEGDDDDDDVNGNKIGEGLENPVLEDAAGECRFSYERGSSNSCAD